jgi:hypothetical protein
MGGDYYRYPAGSPEQYRGTRKRSAREASILSTHQMGPMAGGWDSLRVAYSFGTIGPRESGTEENGLPRMAAGTSRAGTR